MKKLVVVDDEPAICSLIAASLVGEWAVAAVGDGRSAIATALAARPDLILLDVGLPGLSGPAVLERLRAEKALATVPIVYLTGLQPPAGPRPDGLLQKPFTPVTLRSALAGWATAA